MHSRFVLSLAAAAFLATALAPLAAHAESAVAPPRCKVRMLPSGGTITANTPALVVDDVSSPGLSASIVLASSSSKPSLDLDVIPDPRVPGATLLVPKAGAPFEDGATYSLSYSVKCSNPSALTAADETFSFAAKAALPLPSKIGTVRELADGRAVITPTPELSAYLETTRFEAFVDGRSIGATHYGLATGKELDVTIGTYYLSISGAPTTGGTPPACSSDKGLEKHDVKLVAHVAGAATDPAPLDLSLSIDCTATPSTYLPDAGGDDRGASGGDGSSGGCAVSGGGSLGTIAMLFGAGAAVAVLLRRRRRA